MTPQLDERMSRQAWHKDAFCSFCGHPFGAAQGWPRQCTRCEQITYRNPLPVSVVLLPVGEGLLTVRRNIEPGIGELALPGGFIEWGESWQEAGAREVWEETGLGIEPEAIQEYRVRSAPDGTLLIFGLGPEVAASSLPQSPPGAESSELHVLVQPAPLAFSLHSEVVSDYLAKRAAEAK